MKLPITQIKSTGLRRAALIAITPLGVIYLIPTFVIIVWSSLCGAVDGFAEEWGFQTEHLGIVNKAWTAVWSKDWKSNDPDQ